jgi:TM2 domain-containing membrane protein YozV
MKKAIFLIVILASIMTSCSIEKRLYLSGYHIDRNVNTKSTQASKSALFSSEKDLVDENNELKLEDVSASVNVEPNIAKPVLTEEIKVAKIIEEKTSQECDIMLLVEGKELLVKVLEIGLNEVKYKMCNNLNGPTYIRSKNEIFFITYPNGTRDIITRPNDKKTLDSWNLKHSSRRNKNQIIALLLSIFLGVWGIHRFYLDYPIIGIIQLLTGGGFYIWTIIDIIRIIAGDLKPRKGDYYKKI